jgi:hypothetical protein
LKTVIDLKDFNKKMNNLVEYDTGFLNELEKSEYKLNSIVANISIVGFYEFLDSMARIHPDMLHHVYEWDMVGYPNGRLYKLKKTKTGNKVAINYSFLKSKKLSGEYSQEPFYNKAEVMEMGFPVTINEKNSQALFFKYGDTEVFAHGPIRIPNPGGPNVRGSFLKYYSLFYNKYFEDVYLKSINFYRYLSNPVQYEIDFPKGVKLTGYNGGVNAARKWIDKIPGEWND